MTRTITRSIIRGLLPAALLFCYLSSANAIPQGASPVCYLDVTETANTIGDVPPLYGAPTIVGDSLVFAPTDRFNSEATGGGADLTDGQLNFTLKGLNAAVTSFDLSGTGDYTLAGTGTSATTVSYRSSITQFSVLEVDGVPVSSPLLLPGLDVSGSFNVSDGTGIDNPWTSTVIYDINAALSNAGVPFQFGATKLDVVINNVLESASEASSTAEIAANSFAITPTTVPVPEPGVFALTGLAICVITVTRRCRE